MEWLGCASLCILMTSRAPQELVMKCFLIHNAPVRLITYLYVIVYFGMHRAPQDIRRAKLKFQISGPNILVVDELLAKLAFISKF